MNAHPSTNLVEQAETDQSAENRTNSVVPTDARPEEVVPVEETGGNVEEVEEENNEEEKEEEVEVEEEEDYDDAENDEDEKGENEEEFSSSALSPESLLAKYFEEIQERLLFEDRPSEYRRGTFWIEPMSTFFALKKGKQVEYLYRPRVFLWIPHLLNDNGLEGLRCKKLDCNSKLESKGYNKNPHARRTVDLNSCFYLMSLRYSCSNKNCNATLNGHDPKIINQLPLSAQMELPCILTHRGGISKTVADLLRPCIQNSVGPERFQKNLTELHMLQHDRKELQ